MGFAVSANIGPAASAHAVRSRWCKHAGIEHWREGSKFAPAVPSFALFSGVIFQRRSRIHARQQRSTDGRELRPPVTLVVSSSRMRHRTTLAALLGHHLPQVPRNSGSSFIVMPSFFCRYSASIEHFGKSHNGHQHGATARVLCPGTGRSYKPGRRYGRKFASAMQTSCIPFCRQTANPSTCRKRPPFTSSLPAAHRLRHRSGSGGSRRLPGWWFRGHRRRQHHAADFTTRAPDRSV